MQSPGTHYILDTNLFFNMEAGMGMGDKTEDIIVTITGLIRARKSQGDLFYMPPRIMEELLSFFEDENQPFLREFLSELIIKSPEIQNMQINAGMFYKVINEIRVRSYRGMDIGEEEMRKTGAMFMGKEMVDKKGFEMAVGPAIKKFRERYRNATRVGFLDSLADLDIIMLAKELNGIVITADEGVTKWGRMFGVIELPPAVFAERMRQ